MQIRNTADMVSK